MRNKSNQHILMTNITLIHGLCSHCSKICIIKKQKPCNHVHGLINQNYNYMRKIKNE